jgi:chromatin remodeling complex protein RSC6
MFILDDEIKSGCRLPKNLTRIVAYNTSVRLKMVSNSTGSSTMTTAKTTSASPSTGPKRVSKKTDSVAPVAAPEAVAVAAVAAPVKERKTKAKVTETDAATTVAATASTTSSPEASTVAAPEVAAAPSTTLTQDIESITTAFETIRKAASEQIVALKKLSRRVAKEMKEAGRKRRRNNKSKDVTVDGVVKEKRPTIFTTPVTLKDDLCAFLGVSKGSQKTPADVTRAFSAYIDKNGLKDATQGHTIHPDAAMRKVLGLPEGEAISYRNIQTYLYKLYVLPEKKSKAPVA